MKENNILEETKMFWDDHFPDQCPPIDARCEEMIVYRLTKQKQPGKEDFLSHKMRYPSRDFSPLDCQACGLSVHTDYEDVLKLKNRLPALRKFHISIGRIFKDSGVVKETPSKNEKSHVTWWVRTGYQGIQHHFSDYNA
ncbi:conserved hypothetical protein [Brevibacillus sp. IT-7CA2]|uniref:hypothetical protein n=1 Tax=Brevibacillus sp. IT-7CA2 TaxID=3026436 RepID=UPI0039E07C76